MKGIVIVSVTLVDYFMKNYKEKTFFFIKLSLPNIIHIMKFILQIIFIPTI